MKLERNEFMLCVDSTNGLALWDEESNPVKNHGLTVKEQIMINIEDSISIEKLDEKWSVDKNTLLEKLNNGSEEDFKKLWQDIEKFWTKRKSE